MFLDYNLQHDLLNEHRCRLEAEATKERMLKSTDDRPQRIWHYVIGLIPRVIGGEAGDEGQSTMIPVPVVAQ